MRRFSKKRNFQRSFYATNISVAVADVAESALSLSTLVGFSSYGWSTLASGIAKRDTSYIRCGAWTILGSGLASECYLPFRFGSQWARGVPLCAISLAGAAHAVGSRCIIPLASKGLEQASRLRNWTWGNITSGCYRIQTAYHRHHLGSQRAAAEQARDQAHQAQAASGEATAASATPAAEGARV